VDGVEEEKRTSAFTWDSAGMDDHDLRIGGRPGSTGRYMGGICECFYLYDRVLTDEEISWQHLEPYAIFNTDRRFVISVGGEVQTLVISPIGILSTKAVGESELTAVLTAENLPSTASLGESHLTATLTASEVSRASAVGDPQLAATISASSLSRVPVVADPQLLAVLSSLGVPVKRSVGEPSTATVDILSAINILRKSGVGEPKLVFVSIYPSGYVFPLVEISIDLSEIELDVEVS
jgi:hypothetical protein